jgi:hypothetical protein
VSTVSGKLDGLIFVAGMILGSILFAELFPLIETFYSAGSMGAVRLSDVLKVNSGVIALLVSLMAVGAYWLVEKVENKLGDPETLPVGSRKVKLWAAVLLVALGLVLAVINPDRIAAKRTSAAMEGKPKAEAVQKAPPKPAEPASSGAVIIQDEGC